MPEEVLHYLDCRPGKTIVDATVGGAGHSRAILERILPDGMLIGIDQDRDALRHAERVLAPWPANVRLLHGNFSRISELIESIGIRSVDGILADLGISLYHIEASGRGFSFSRDEPLDMRMNTDTEMTAELMVNTLAEGELKRIFREYGEERWAGRIARAIVAERKGCPVRSSLSLAEIVRRAVPAPKKKPGAKSGEGRRIHPATRVFMALRIAVNRELDSIEAFMDQAPGLLAPGGRLCVLSFHSLEDRIVKHAYKELLELCTCPKSMPCICDKTPKVKVLTRKPIEPGEEEIERNPRSRSAKLRVVEKI